MSKYDIHVENECMRHVKSTAQLVAGLSVRYQSSCSGEYGTAPSVDIKKAFFFFRVERAKTCFFLFACDAVTVESKAGERDTDDSRGVAVLTATICEGQAEMGSDGTQDDMRKRKTRSNRLRDPPERPAPTARPYGSSARPVWSLHRARD
ncbi:hypothetical protein L249_7875 [Ophiocordyceps polyrhachis-furcata BCC 54312]|uniref:Uncharacterized protein n=1 Tax=Ophiocordyceps polyrhachis-furcata BCC 54312 TaxID=1330021 RepID=A0A367L0M4_9HYPO|nr:hypothetical protein L249_7875 [Ophiocordyceps polyrhachis-furcata BCC 54312]